jgi:hypothetical protein
LGIFLSFELVLKKQPNVISYFLHVPMIGNFILGQQQQIKKE